MKIDLSKYLKNKDISITNDDFDIEGLEKEVLKGYTSNAEVKKQIEASTKDMINKSDYDKLQSDFSNLESNYNNTIKILDDTNSKNERLSLENKLTRKGFKDEDFDEVIKIRNSVFADEKDDTKAIDELVEKYKNTYFPEDNKKEIFTPAPNESPIKADDTKVENIKITRNTSVKDLLIKK